MFDSVCMCGILKFKPTFKNWYAVAIAGKFGELGEFDLGELSVIGLTKTIQIKKVNT